MCCLLLRARPHPQNCCSRDYVLPPDLASSSSRMLRVAANRVCHPIEENQPRNSQMSFFTTDSQHSPLLRCLGARNAPPLTRRPQLLKQLQRLRHLLFAWQRLREERRQQLVHELRRDRRALPLRARDARPSSVFPVLLDVVAFGRLLAPLWLEARQEVGLIRARDPQPGLFAGREAVVAVGPAMVILSRLARR